jgi:hypothetical protein
VSHEYRTLAAQIGLDDLATYSSAAEEIVRRSRYHEIEPYELAAARTSPTSHAQVAEEPIYTLDFYEVELADVMRSLEVIFERPVARGGLDKGSLTLFPGAQTAKSEVIAVTSFAVSLAGLKISESQTGLKLERIPDFRGNCDRPRADVAKLLSALTRGRETASASIELAAAPAFDAIRVLSEGLSVLIAVHPRDPPVGEITLSSGPRTLPEAYAMFFAALEKQGNRVLTGPNGSLAIVGCPRESPREERVETELPRVLGTLVSQSSTLALITEGLWNRTFRAGEFFHDGKHNGKLLEIRSGAVLFEQRGRCAVLAVGEAGAGRSVECPTTPPTIDPRPR